VEFAGTAVDTAGVSVMVIGAIIATARFLLKSQADALNAYRVCRQDLGRAILLGLEFLVAGALFGLWSSIPRRVVVPA
jgi:uncharacterized membrane protein